MTFRHGFALCALLALVPLAACSGSASSALPPQTPQSQCAPPVQRSDDARFAVHDDFMGPIPHTHVLQARASASEGTPCVVEHIARLQYHGGTVQTAPAIYVVFWGFQTYGDPTGESARLTAFLNAVGASSWLNTVTQYYQNGPHYIANPASQLAGTWYDDTNPVPAHPRDADIKAEAARLAQHVGVASSDAAYIVATPTGHNIKGFPKGYCAYHGDTGGGRIAYTNLPYISDGGYYCGNNSVNRGAAGKLDGVTIIAGHELAETQTDPGVGGWWDAFGNEIGDKCAWKHLQNTNFGTLGTFPTQPLWSNALNACMQ
jgi:serine protease